MKAILEVINGEFSGRKLALRSPVRLTVGRTSMADYAIPYDSQMSSIHFEIELEMQGACLRDRGSTNGTYVNDSRVAFVELGDGDAIRAGGSKFSIQFEEAAPAARKEKPSTVSEDTSAPRSEAADRPAAAADPMEQASPMSLVFNENAVRERSSNYQAEFDAEQTAEPRGVISSARPFAEAFSDDLPAVVEAALEAAVWTRQPWLLDYCREQRREPRVERLPFFEMLAVLAEPTDLASIQALALNAELGAARMGIVGKFGHPALLPFLIENFANADARTAVAAGRAFQKIVGGDFQSDDRVQLPPEDGSQPDDFDAEFLDEEKLPDADKARQYLGQQASTLNKSPRWSRGLDVSRPLSRELFMQLDLESRWEAAMRGSYRQELRLSPALLKNLNGLPR